MARRFISIVCLEIVSRRFILCVPNGKEEWLVDLYLLCVPNGKEDLYLVCLEWKRRVARRFISIVCP